MEGPKSPTIADQARDLLTYTLWADRRALAAVAKIDREDLTREAGASFGSLLGTFAHILGAEKVWLSRFLGTPLSRVPDLSDYPSLETLLTGFEDLWADLEFFMASLDASQLSSALQWTTTRGESHQRLLWQAVVHMTNHSTYHRGQIVMLMRQMGYDPPSTDLIYFFPEAEL